MDYLSELLESYDKLKKRTFKLTYLTEEEKKKEKEEEPRDPAVMKAARSLAKEAISSAKALPNSSGASEQLAFITKVDGTPSTLKIFRNLAQNAVTVLGLGPQGGALRVEKDGATVPTAFEALVKRLGDDEKLSGSQQAVVDGEQAEADRAAQEEAKRLALLEKLGGSFELAGRDPAELKVIIQNLKRSERALKEFCTHMDPEQIRGSLKNLCGRPRMYIAGASNSGFEYKLSVGKAIIIDPETGKRTGVGPIELGLLQTATESHAALTDFLSGDGDCDTIKDRVGFFKDKLVLFGDAPSEGVTIEPNALQQAAIERLNNDCDTPDLTEVISDTFSNNEINAVKGTFNELTLQLAVRLVAAKTEKERVSSFKEIAKEINNRKQLLTSYASTQDTQGDIALGFDASFDNEILLEQAGIAQDNATLRKWFLKEISMQLEFVRAMGADDVIPAGQDVITGSREDTLLVYKDEARATAAAEFVGAEVQKGKGGWTVGIGQKRVTDAQKVKIGEINSTSRMLKIFSGQAKDKNLSEGFTDAITAMQFGSNESRLEEASSWLNDLEENIDSATESLAQYATYIDADGKIKSVKPEDRIRTIAGSIKGLLDYDTLKTSSLGRALFADKGDFRDYSDTSTQQRTREVVQREARFKSMKDAILEGNQAAQDSLVRMALISGANTTNMGQLITENSGESFVISHNEALEKIAKANTAGTLEVSINGTTASLNAGGISVSFSQEGSWSGGARNTRSVTKLPRATIEKLNRQKKTQKESTLDQFLKGQMKLLETILNQSNNSLSL